VVAGSGSNAQGGRRLCRIEQGGHQTIDRLGLAHAVQAVFDDAHAQTVALVPAAELAALYHERWQIETAMAELKSRLLVTPSLSRESTSKKRSGSLSEEYWD
jgi:IS4 transposase